MGEVGAEDGAGVGRDVGLAVVMAVGVGEEEQTAVRIASFCRLEYGGLVRQDGRQVRPGLDWRYSWMEVLKLQNDEGTAPESLLLSR